MHTLESIVLTCAQPTGQLHVGNYFGAVQHWVRLQEAHTCYFGIVDLHAITVPYKPADLRRSTLECMAQYMACGLDPQKSKLFVQSHVVGHTELAWILGCLTSLGRLERMTQFKHKAQRRGQAVSSGLLTYPVLMAADILLYNATLVPVGDDQKQHLELARGLVQKFNTTYSETFRVPEPAITKTGARIMSLQQPTVKMSKSDPNPNSAVFLLDPPERIRKKILCAVTDSGNDIVTSPEKPGITNLLRLLSTATGQSMSDLEHTYAFQGYAVFKRVLADALIALVEPIQKRYRELIEDKAYLKEVMKEGAAAAQTRAYKTLSKVYRKCGFCEPVR